MASCTATVIVKQGSGYMTLQCERAPQHHLDWYNSDRTLIAPGTPHRWSFEWDDDEGNDVERDHDFDISDAVDPLQHETLLEAGDERRP